MLGNVYLKGDEIYLRYDLIENIGERTGCIYQLGHHLLNFIWCDMETVKGAFNSIVKLYLDPQYLKKADEFTEKLNEWIEYIDNYCPYLHFYVQTLINILLDLPSDCTALNRLRAIATDSTKMFSEIDKFVSVQQNLLPNFNRLTNGIEIAERILLADVNAKREKIRNEIDFITSRKDELKDLTPMQRLYLIDNKRNTPYYTNTDFKARFVPNRIIPKNIDAKDFVIQNDVKIVEMYAIDSIDNLIKFELLKMIASGVNIKKCKYCGHYFIPTGRTDTEYCNRIYVGETKECNLIGAMKNHKAKLEGDPIFIAYNKAYKRNHSRVRYKKMTNRDFFDWSELARQKKGECNENIITLQEYQAWLDIEK